MDYMIVSEKCPMGLALRVEEFRESRFLPFGGVAVSSTRANWWSIPHPMFHQALYIERVKDD